MAPTQPPNPQQAVLSAIQTFEDSSAALARADDTLTTAEEKLAATTAAQAKAKVDDDLAKTAYNASIDGLITALQAVKRN